MKKIIIFVLTFTVAGCAAFGQTSQRWGSCDPSEKHTINKVGHSRCGDGASPRVTREQKADRQVSSY